MPEMTFKQLEECVVLTGDLQHDLSAQTSLYYQVAVGATRASTAVDQSRYELLCLEAELQEEVRKAAAAEKVTEALIASRIKAHPRYVELFSEHLAVQRLSGEWDALRKAYESRSHLLHDLTLLATRGVDSGGINSYAEMRQAASQVRRTQLKKS